MSPLLSVGRYHRLAGTCRLARLRSTGLQIGEDAREQIRPFPLPGFVADFVVADFDHRAGQAARARVPLQREIDAVGRRIGLVDADRRRPQRSQRGDQRRGEPRVVVMDDADLPGPRHAL